MPWQVFEVKERICIKEMFSFFEEIFQNGYDYGGEAHNFWECMLVEEGEVFVSADERVYRLKRNEIIFHKPFEFHKFRIEGCGDAQLLIFSFSLEGSLCNYFKNKVFKLNDEQEKIVRAMMKYAKERCPKTEISGEGGCYRYLLPFKRIKTYSQMLVTYIYQLFLSLEDGGEISDVLADPELGIFGKAVRYMRSNLHGGLTVSQIAKFCGVSESGLKRIFGTYTGIGIHKYFVQMKIEAASKLLAGGATVNEVAEKLGFSSQAYFSMMFKRETNMSPSEFRQILNNSGKRG